MGKVNLTYLEAAVRILHDAGRPLSTRELTDSAIAAGLIKPEGSTPQATMSAVLYRKVQADSRLVKIEDAGGRARAKRGSVFWALSSWP
jgi:HB1, ASXL, restriction endonuclease HTH domain